MPDPKTTKIRRFRDGFLIGAAFGTVLVGGVMLSIALWPHKAPSVEQIACSLFNQDARQGEANVALARRAMTDAAFAKWAEVARAAFFYAREGDRHLGCSPEVHALGEGKFSVRITVADTPAPLAIEDARKPLTSAAAAPARQLSYEMALAFNSLGQIEHLAVNGEATRPTQEESSK